MLTLFIRISSDGTDFNTEVAGVPDFRVNVGLEHLKKRGEVLDSDFHFISELQRTLKRQKIRMVHTDESWWELKSKFLFHMNF